MKKSILSLTVLALFFSMAQVVAPSRADAVIIIQAASGRVLRPNLPEIVLCVILLPLCLLDEKATPSKVYTAQDLLDNGYTESAVAVIIQDQNQMMSELMSKGQTFVFEANDTPMTVESSLRAMDPEVSNDYINFVVDVNHVGVRN